MNQKEWNTNILFALLGMIPVFAGIQKEILSPWIFFALPLAFLLSPVFHFLVRLWEEIFRQGITEGLFFLLFLSLVYFYLLKEPLYNALPQLGSFCSSLLLLCGIFIFWNHAPYIYLLGAFALMLSSTTEETSFLLWGIFLVLLVCSLVFHHHSLQNIYFFSPKKRTKSPLPWKMAFGFSLLSIILLASFSFTSYKIYQWLEKEMEERISSQQKASLSPNPSPELPGNKFPDPGSEPPFEKNPSRNSSGSLPEAGKINLPELGVTPRVRFEKDLKFGNMNLDQIQAIPLFEVSMARSGARFYQYQREPLWKVAILDRFSPEKGIWYLSPQTPEKLTSSEEGGIEISPLPPERTHLLVNVHFKISPALSRNIIQFGTPHLLFYSAVWRDQEGSLISSHSLSQGFLEYSMDSSLPRMERASQWKLAWEDERYYDLPLHRKEYENLARSITKKHHLPFQKVKAIENYLRRYYAYDLQPDLDGKDSTYQFLFEAKRGYCQHFASAMVFLLRSLQIPSRIAIGFKGGTVKAKKDSQVFLVTSLHGHAWVEVKFDPVGWVAFDPVASASGEAQSKREEKIQEAGKTDFLDGKEDSSNPSSGSKNPSPPSGEKDFSTPPQMGGMDFKEENPPSLPGKKTPPAPKPGENPSSKEPASGKNPSSPPNSTRGKNPPSQGDPQKKPSTHKTGDPEKNPSSEKNGSSQNPSLQSHPGNSKTENFQEIQKQEMKTDSGKTSSNKKSSPFSMEKGMALLATLLGHFLAVALLFLFFWKGKNFWMLLYALFLEWWKGGGEKKENSSPKESAIQAIYSFLGFSSPHLSAREKVIQSFCLLSEKLKKLHLGRASHWTANEYAGKLAESFPLQKRSIENLLTLFLKSRYSPGEITETEAHQAEGWAEEILNGIPSSFSIKKHE